MITFLVMLGGSPVCLGSVIVVFRCFVMGVLRHIFISPRGRANSGRAT
jgi:hypothetical protein